MSERTLLGFISTRSTLLLFLALFWGSSSLFAERIDGTIDIEGETREYSLYVPDEYTSDDAWPLMLAMHPLNPSRWNARSWCDTLVDFAAANGLLLICPDGGPGGNLTDELTDTLLASMLLDSMSVWYRIDERRIYVGGFSMGGAATYLYGLSESHRFGGLMPIGAAISGTSSFDHLFSNASGLPVAIIHGALDAPAIRFTPVVEGLREAGAVVRSELLQGVGHTIDFPDRNQILTTSFHWLDSVNLSRGTNSVGYRGERLHRRLLFPNTTRPGGTIVMECGREFELEYVRLVAADGRAYAMEGVQKIVRQGDTSVHLVLPDRIGTGFYILQAMTTNGEKISGRVLVR